jgi:F-type H+-transporting ATPase subunit delta
MTNRKKIAAFARQLFKLSLENGKVSAERVSGVLAWVEKTRPASAIALLRAYKRLIETEIDRSRAVIEFAGDVSPAIFQQIAASMSAHFGRDIEAVPVARPELIAGIRVRVGCDIFENSVVSQLATLSSAN